MNRGRFFARKDVQLMFDEAGFKDIDIGPVRPKKKLIKRLGRALFGDLVIKGFLITRVPSLSLFLWPILRKTEI